jgi:hypothetical protein
MISIIDVIFSSELQRIEASEFMLTMIVDRSCPINPMATHAVYTKGNMTTIAKSIPIDISRTSGIMQIVFVGVDCSPEEIQIYTDLFKEFCDVFAWYYEEMLGIDPRIVEHEIMTYPDTKPVWQKLHLVNPQKETNIKDEVEKLIKVGFIYTIQLTQWVSNPISVNKKQGMICICMEFCDLNNACPKDNFPTPFIN